MHKIYISIIIIIVLFFLFLLYNNQSSSSLIINSIKDVSPSVVSIVVFDENNNKKCFGSGFIFDNEGFIVTNTHVIANSENILVTTIGGEKHNAKIIGTDILTDLALLKIDANNLFLPAKLGNSDKIEIGEPVITLGNPNNLYSISKEPIATTGIISGRNINFGLKGKNAYQQMIQTDASINQGNSGGPLVNLSGEVIGINTFIVSEPNGTGGFGFSIPINRVKDVINDLKTFGRIDRNWVTGLSVREISEKYQKAFKLKSKEGVIVSDVERYSAADEAGIMLRDVIYKVNNRIVNTAQEIEEVLGEGYFKTGDQVDIIIIRNNKEIKVNLLLIDPHDITIKNRKKDDR